MTTGCCGSTACTSATGAFVAAAAVALDAWAAAGEVAFACLPLDAPYELKVV